MPSTDTSISTLPCKECLVFPACKVKYYYALKDKINFSRIRENLSFNCIILRHWFPNLSDENFHQYTSIFHKHYWSIYPNYRENEYDVAM